MAFDIEATAYDGCAGPAFIRAARLVRQAVAPRYWTMPLSWSPARPPVTQSLRHSIYALYQHEKYLTLCDIRRIANSQKIQNIARGARTLVLGRAVMPASSGSPDGSQGRGDINEQKVGFQGGHRMDKRK